MAFALLVFIVVGIFIFYTLKFGSPSILTANAENSERMKALFKKQGTLISIQNESNYEDYEVDKLQVTFLDSSFALHQETIAVLSQFNGRSIQLDKKHTMNWKGQCLLAIVEYWRKNTDGKNEMKYQLFLSEERFKLSNGILQITN